MTAVCITRYPRWIYSVTDRTTQLCSGSPTAALGSGTPTIALTYKGDRRIETVFAFVFFSKIMYRIQQWCQNRHNRIDSSEPYVCALTHTLSHEQTHTHILHVYWHRHTQHTCTRTDHLYLHFFVYFL